MENIFISSDESGSNIDTEKSISESNKSSISYVASVNDSEANEVYSNMIGGGQRPNTSPNNPTSPKQLVKEKTKKKDDENFFTGIIKGVEKVGKKLGEEGKKLIEKNEENLKDQNGNIIKLLNEVKFEDIKKLLIDKSSKPESFFLRQFLLAELPKLPKLPVEQRQNTIVGKGNALVGGGNEYNIEPKKYRKYYEKYLKYKLKYLELKYD